MRARKMLRAIILGAALGCTVLLTVTGPAAAAEARPAWEVQALSAPSVFEAGGKGTYQVYFTNSGAKATDGSELRIVDSLPAGLTVSGVHLRRNTPTTVGVDYASSACTVNSAGDAAGVACLIDNGLGPGSPAVLGTNDQFWLTVEVEVPPAPFGGQLINRVSIGGGGAEPSTAESSNEARAEADPQAVAGFQEFQARALWSDGTSATGPGSHPYQYVTSFAVNLNPAPTGSQAPFVPAQGDLKQIEVALPPGLVGNPNAVARCSRQQFMVTSTDHNERDPAGTVFPNHCPDSSAVGLITFEQVEGKGQVFHGFPIYNLVPPVGMPAQLGFKLAALPVYIDTKLRSDGDYGITAYLPDVTEAQRVTAARVAIWGDPGAASHDLLRGKCAETERDECPYGLDPVEPFLRLPTACGNPLLTGMAYQTWGSGTTAATSATSAAPTGCSAPPFAPSIEAKATTSAADSPSGLHFDLHNPQPQDPEAPGEADLRDATVTLPEGFVVNPSSADGLGACSEAQIGYTGTSEGRPSFTAAPAQCPDAAKIGTVTVKTPLVDHPLPGAVYLARQGENPFDSLLAIYITVNDPQTGVVVKLSGKVTPDPVTGRLTTTVQQSPQLPFEDFELDFFEGARAPLRTPASCGLHTTTTTLVPWSAPEGPTVHPQGAFQTTSPAAGQAACPTGGELPASWSFAAGSQAPLAGAYSPFTVHLARPDGSQELSALEVALPPGVAARFAGVPECSDAQIAAAKAREAPGQGKVEQQSPSCPAASRIGTATVGAGAGPNPYYVSGDAYLAGPYRGAPFSIVVITPAVAGPFDLGAVVVRSALEVDPFSARGTVKSDPIPRILDGIPLDVRSLTVKVDRPGFTLNPTSCEAMAVGGRAISVGGAATAVANRFQVGDCGALKFRPKLKLRLKGATGQAAHPALRAVLTARPGEANIRRAQVNLPHAEFLDQGNLNKTCTRPVLLAGNCPRSSVYGRAKAWTPLLEKPLQGPVYLVGGFGYKLPALVAELNGRIRVLLVGKVDSGKNKGIRNTFEVVPDAPVSRFELRMKGGKRYGLLQNSENLCKAKKSKRRAIVRFTGQNGKVEHYKPVVRNDCGKHKKKKTKKRARHARAGSSRGAAGPGRLG